MLAHTISDQALTIWLYTNSIIILLLLLLGTPAQYYCYFLTLCKYNPKVVLKLTNCMQRSGIIVQAIVKQHCIITLYQDRDTLVSLASSELTVILLPRSFRRCQAVVLMTLKDSTAMGLQRDTGHRCSRLYRYFSSLWEAASSAAAAASWAALVTYKSANGAGPSCKRGCESYRHQLDNCICTDEDAKIQTESKAHCDSHRLVIKLKTTRGDKQSERSVSTVRRDAARNDSRWCVWNWNWLLQVPCPAADPRMVVWWARYL